MKWITDNGQCSHYQLSIINYQLLLINYHVESKSWIGADDLYPS